MLAASTDSYWTHKAWFESNALLRDVRYPVLADTAHELTKAYGILLPDGSALRATVLIDPDGEIRHLSVSDNSVGRSPEETLRVLQALRTGALPGQLASGPADHGDRCLTANWPAACTGIRSRGFRAQTPKAPLRGRGSARGCYSVREQRAYQLVEG